MNTDVEVPACPKCGSRNWSRDENCRATRTIRISAGLSNTLVDGSVKDYEWGEDDDWHGMGWHCENNHYLDAGDDYDTLNELVDGY